MSIRIQSHTIPTTPRLTIRTLPPRQKREPESESDYSESSDDDNFETFDHSSPVGPSLDYAAIVEEMRAALPVLVEPHVAAPKPTARDVASVGELYVFISALVTLCLNLVEISEMLRPIQIDSGSYRDVSRIANLRFIALVRQFRQMAFSTVGVFIRNELRAIRCAREMSPVEQHSVQSKMFTFMTRCTYVIVTNHSDTFDKLVVASLKLVELLSHIAVDDKVYNLFEFDEKTLASVMSRFICESYGQVNEEVIQTIFVDVPLKDSQENIVSRICYEMFL